MTKDITERRNTPDPVSAIPKGARYLYCGRYFKEGRNGKLLHWDGIEWCKSPLESQFDGDVRSHDLFGMTAAMRESRAMQEERLRANREVSRDA